MLAPLSPNGFDYDYWHWSPDEILGMTNLLGGFTNASAYAFTSISNSFNDIAGWHLTNGGPRMWVAPYFNATREGSYQLEQQLGIQITGDDKLTPFPHWIFSTQTPDKYYSTLSEPVSDWFVTSPFAQISQSMENGHTVATVQAMVDAYYNLGGLINLYNHASSDGSGEDGTLASSYVTYSLSKPKIWSANAAKIYSWWLQRSNVVMTTSFTTNGVQSITTISLSGNSNTNAAVELVAPSAAYVSLQVSTNGVLAGTSVYRTSGQTIKLLVGTTVTNAVVNYILPPSIQNNFFQVTQGSPLTVPAPGILSNGTASATATLVGGPANGSLTLNADGSFTYTPTNNFSGVDNFTYAAVSGSLTSARGHGTISVTTPGELFYDSFARPANSSSIFPWVNEPDMGYDQQRADWQQRLEQLRLRVLQRQLDKLFGAGASQIFIHERMGGGIAGRLNPVTGARYSVWVYPENSPAGPQNGHATMQVIKYENWTVYTAQRSGDAARGGNELPYCKVELQWHQHLCVFCKAGRCIPHNSCSIDAIQELLSFSIILSNYSFRVSISIFINVINGFFKRFYYLYP